MTAKIDGFILKKLYPLFGFIERKKKPLIKLAVVFVLYLLFGHLVGYLYHNVKSSLVYATKDEKEMINLAKERLFGSEDACDPLRCIYFFEVLSVKKLDKPIVLVDTKEKQYIFGEVASTVTQNRSKLHDYSEQQYRSYFCEPGEYLVTGRKFSGIPSFITNRGIVDVCFLAYPYTNWRIK